jgi:simple sugar transport system substrate-binding protein
MTALGKPFGFGEMGHAVPPTPDSRNWDQTRIIRTIKDRYPAATFWYSWSSWEPDGFYAMVDLPHAEELMTDSLVATREDVDFPRAAEQSNGAPDGSGKGDLKVGFIDFTIGQARGGFYPFEAGWRLAQEGLAPWLDAVPVRGVGMGGFGKAVDRLVRQEGCTAIFTNAHSGYDPQILEAARRYPGVLFEAPQAGQAARPPNLRTYGVDDNEAQYLMGAIAGAIVQSRRIGYVGWSAENWQLVKINEFALGVRETNPNARILLRLADGNPLEAARALLGQGCGVFNGAVDQEPILKLFQDSASRGKRVYAFGDWTPREAHPEVIIASQLSDLSVLFGRVLTDLRAGKEAPRDFWMSIRDGAVQFKAESIMPAMIAILRQKQVRVPGLREMSAYDFVMLRFEQLRRGEYEPFTGPIRDQKGRLRVPEGVSYGGWEFKGEIDWLLDNVQGDLSKR